MSNKFPLDSNYDLEQQFILRMIDHNAAKNLADEIEAGVSFKENFTIEFKPDLRHAIVRYNGQVYQGQLVDLACITESLKTTDKKNFYKTADICQMLVCTQGDETGPLRGSAAYLDRQVGGSRNESGSFDVNRDNRKFQFLHGITPPLKNVLRRRFRKTRKKRFVDMPKIEKEVKQLLRTDLQANSVKWELIWNDPNPSVNRLNFGKKLDPSSSTTAGHISQSEIGEQVTVDDELEDEDDEGVRAYTINHQDVFGEISSSSMGSSSECSEDEHDTGREKCEQPSKPDSKQNRTEKSITQESSLYSSQTFTKDKHLSESALLPLSLSQIKENELAAELLLSDSEEEDGDERAIQPNIDQPGLYDDDDDDGDTSCTYADDDDELQASVAAVDLPSSTIGNSSQNRLGSHNLMDIPVHNVVTEVIDDGDEDEEEEDEDIMHRGGELLDDITYMGFDNTDDGRQHYENSFNTDEDIV